MHPYSSNHDIYHLGGEDSELEYGHYDDNMNIKMIPPSNLVTELIESPPQESLPNTSSQLRST